MYKRQVLVLYLNFVDKTDTESEVLQRLGLEGFKVVEKKENNILGISFIRMTATNGSLTLKTEYAKGINTVRARQYIAEKRFGIESLYISIPSPYPDVITRTIECPEKFKPVFDITNQDDQDSLYYILYATERFTYGVCSDDLVKYRAIFYLVHCKQKSELYQIESFIAPEEFADDLVDMLRSFKC